MVSGVSDCDIRNHTGSHKINNAIGQVRPPSLILYIAVLTMVRTTDPSCEADRKDSYYC